MPQTVTVKQIQKLDKIAIERYGVPSIALMENAGRAVAMEVLQRLSKRRHRLHVCIVCGVGNNAGDGFVAARHLMNAGVLPKIFLVGRGNQLKHDARLNYQILKKIKYPVSEIGHVLLHSFEGALKGADIVVDAIFGVGLNRNIESPFKEIIEIMNRTAKKVVAVDVPSGLDGTTGKIYGACIKAHTTVTFSFAKRGFFIRYGPRHTGKIVVVDIGIPKL